MKKVSLIEMILGFNALELLGIFLTLLMAFALQFFLHELPCPLCLLQRIGFLSIAVGFLMNLRFGLRPSHYALVLLSALFTSFVALRQIALHVIPGSPGYGSEIFGLHLYTWSFIVSMIIIIITTFLLGIDRQYQSTPKQQMRYPKLTPVLFGLMALIITANIVSLGLECGFSECPDNPTQYKNLTS